MDVEAQDDGIMGKIVVRICMHSYEKQLLILSDSI